MCRRYGLPIENKDVRELQKSIELIKDNILAKRLSAAVGDANNAARLSSGKSAEKILASVRAEDRADMEKLLGEINQDLGPLAGVLGESNQRGSPQERDALDKAYKTQETLSAKLSAIEARAARAARALSLSLSALKPLRPWRARRRTWCPRATR